MNHKSSEALITLTSEVGLSHGVKITPGTVFNINDYTCILNGTTCIYKLKK